MTAKNHQTPTELVERLKDAGSDPAALQAVLGRVGFGIDAVERYCHFDRGHYTRNLIARTESFELLVLCWEPGQVTPIHDHAGSDGWVRCLHGEVEEVRYQVSPSASGEAGIVKGDSATATAGNMTHINDDIAWHTVGNPTDQRAVSLHLYAGPIDSCRYVDPESRQIRDRRLGYHSIDGALVDQSKRRRRGPAWVGANRSSISLRETPE
jgi:cysteine dioxygenase